MAVQAISFNKNGYDPFIDFLKAYSILCVVIAHILPTALFKYILFQVWGEMQVPMFILIQVFHAYKKDQRPKVKWVSLLKRIIVPFIAIQVVIVGFKALVTGGFSLSLLFQGLMLGGYGPGAYYIWVYLQIAIILVLLWGWIIKVSLKQVLLVFLFISVGFEVLFSIVDCPEPIYRLLCTRYLFLIPLGLIWLRKGVFLNRNNILLSILSIVAVLFFVFTDYDLEPFFFNTNWRFHRWICYFYVPLLLTYGLSLIWRRIKETALIEKQVKWIATRSYEIYLAQMMVIACIKTIVPSLVSNGVVVFGILACVIFVSSFIFGGIIYWFRKVILKW